MNPPAPVLSVFSEQQTVFEMGWSEWVLALVLLAAIAVLLLGYVNVRRASPSRKLLLLSLRTGAVLLALLIFLEPAIRRREVTRIRNTVPVLVDASASMALHDRPGQPSRAEQVAGWLAGQDEELQRLAVEHQLHFYTFGEELRTADSKGLARQPPATEQATLLLEALEQAARRSKSEDLGGFIVVTDGADNGLLGRRMVPSRPLDPEIKDRLHALGAPVNAFLAGQAGGMVDLAVQRVVHDDFAFVHNALEIEVDVLATGLSSGSVEALLSEEGAPLQTRPLVLEPGTNRYRLTFSFTPSQVGKHHYRISLPHLRGETILVNNQQDFLIHVIRDRIRVLQVCGRPSWDERFLRDLLKKSPNVDLISFFILRTATNLHIVPSSELSLIPFPAQELFEKEIKSFDVVFFQNFDYRPYQMRRYLRHLRDYVLEGGGLAMLGGELSFTAGGYAGTPVESVLPVGLPPLGAEQDLLLYGSFPLQLTDAGRRHPIMALSPLAEENEKTWSRLPLLEGANRVLGPTPQAVVLATTPPLGGGLPPQPLVVAGSVGKGRTLAVLTDSTWRWTLPHAGQGGDLRPYTRFWGNAIRWLIQDPEQKLLTLTTDGDRYPEQAEVRAEVRLLDSSYRPASKVAVTLARRPKDPQAAPTSPAAAAAAGGGAAAAAAAVAFGPGEPGAGGAEQSTVLLTDDEGRASWSFPAGAPGVWTVSASAMVEGMQQADTTIYLAGVASREMEDVVPRSDLLAAVSSTTQGTLRSLSDPLAAAALRPSRVLRVHRQETHPLWNHPAVLLVALALLSAEWWLRRRWGFL